VSRALSANLVTGAMFIVVVIVSGSLDVPSRSSQFNLRPPSN
jgi:hypothetical protein